jgi:hypothetical protein
VFTTVEGRAHLFSAVFHILELIIMGETPKEAADRLRAEIQTPQQKRKAAEAAQRRDAVKPVGSGKKPGTGNNPSGAGGLEPGNREWEKSPRLKANRKDK